MKASELRIGNYYMNQDGSLRGVPNGVVGQIKDGGDLDFAHFMLPIPLTEEWLVKFGFEKRRNDSYVNGFEFILKPEDGPEFNGIGHYGWLKGDKSLVVNTLCRGNYVCNSVRYVHQLQNLYFALTGEELTPSSAITRQRY